MSLFNGAHMTSYWLSIATMGLSCAISEIDDDFTRKSQNFPTPLYFVPPLKGFPLELGIGAGDQKTRMMGLSGWQRSLMISSAVWIECTNVTDRQTTGPQQRPHFCIASHGKNWVGAVAGADWSFHHPKDDERHHSDVRHLLLEQNQEWFDLVLVFPGC